MRSGERLPTYGAAPGSHAPHRCVGAAESSGLATHGSSLGLAVPTLGVVQAKRRQPERPCSRYLSSTSVPLLASNVHRLSASIRLMSGVRTDASPPPCAMSRSESVITVENS